MIASVTRFINDILLSAPSIVIGLFVYTIYVARWPLLRLGRVVRARADRDSGGCAHHREHVASGARQLARGRRRAGGADVEGVLMVTLKRRAGGVITGVLLAIARMSGETAPLLFTALNNQFWSTDMKRRWPTCRL